MADAPRAIMAEKRRKIAQRQRRMKLLFLSIFIAAISLVFYVGFDFNNQQAAKNSSAQVENSKSKNFLSAKDNERINIMLMGVDERKEDVGRSDTLMVASLDTNEDKISLLSIPRDTRVKIKRHGYDKINAAYAYGGESLSQSTVENFLGIDIDHYVIVSTESFAKMIDAIGGVDIDVEKRMFYEDPWDDNGGLVIDLKPGLQHMNGETAITYVRYRDEEGDAGRVRRQQNFMRACLDKLSSPKIVMNLPEILSEARKAVKTDLSVGEMIEIATALKNSEENHDGLKTGIVPGHWLYINGVSYLVPDIERLEEVVTDNLGIDSSKIEEHFEKIAYEYEDSVPFYIDKNEPEYDENVNKEKDRELIDFLNEINFEITNSNV